MGLAGSEGACAWVRAVFAWTASPLAALSVRRADSSWGRLASAVAAVAAPAAAAIYGSGAKLGSRRCESLAAASTAPDKEGSLRPGSVCAVCPAWAEQRRLNQSRNDFLPWDAS